MLWGREHCPALKNLLKDKDAKRKEDVGLTAVNCQVLAEVLVGQGCGAELLDPSWPAPFAADYAPALDFV